MRFGIREVADMHFEKLSGKGPQSFNIESAKTSTLEGASTTVYAQGGKGNSRLMAWEGEKTLTFTVEDALITMESFYALTGAEVSRQVTAREGILNSGIKFTSKTTSFAGYYSITADTLFRDEEGNDHPAYITIPRAKLQSNLNLTMAPSGDPSAFTFTFDAFPGIEDANKDVLFTLEIYDHEDESLELNEAEKDETIVILNNVTYRTKGTNPKVTITSGVVNLTATGADTVAIAATFADDDTGVTDLVNFYEKANSTINLTEGTTTRLYII